VSRSAAEGRAPPAPPPWWVGPATAIGAGLVRLLGTSWRIGRVGVREYDARLARGERCIFAFWHARLLPLVYTHRGRGIAVLVSRSRDGELIAGVIERLGFVTARGSSSRAGGEGILDMLEWAGKGHLLALTPDGPRGPAGQVKPGLAYLASRTGLPVVPVATAAKRAWVLSSWDRFRVPGPFARVWVAYGEPLRVPAGLDDAAARAWGARLEGAIHDLTLELARRAGESDRDRAGESG